MQRFIRFQNPPFFISHASVGGYEEGSGPLASLLDLHDQSDKFGQDTWERAEGELGRTALNLALKKGGIKPCEVDILLAGDLQNQCVASSGGLYSFGIPYLGLYGACSTCTESLFLLSSLLSEGDTYRIGAAVTTSHNSAAERQFRLPLEYGGQRPPTAQWTATAGGSFLLSSCVKREGGVRILGGMAGRIVDGEISDASNMGAAMAPAAADTLLSFFSLGILSPAELDAVVTGDLGRLGSELLLDLTEEKGLFIRDLHLDCGCLLYDGRKRDIHAGGSGCGCSASVLSSYFIPRLERGEYKNILFLSTGALMSPSSVQQGDPIYGIAPLILLSSTQK